MKDKCEVCKTAKVWSYGRIVRDKHTKIARILNICQPCFERITGAK